jgi:hypothetical protein
MPNDDMPNEDVPNDDMPNDESDVSRRRFLQSLSAVSLAGLGGSLLVGCGGGSGSESGGGSGGGSGGSGQGSALGPASTDLDCTDVSQLSDAQMKQREQMVNSLQYVEQTEQEGKYCANCQLYQQPEDEETTGSDCGGCQLFPGGVHPNGYCTSWAPAA